MHSASNWDECLLLDFQTQCWGIILSLKMQMCNFHSLQQSWHTKRRMYCRGSQGTFYVFSRGMKQEIKHFKSVSCMGEGKKKKTSGHLQSLKKKDLIWPMAAKLCSMHTYRRQQTVSETMLRTTIIARWTILISKVLTLQFFLGKYSLLIFGTT